MCVCVLYISTYLPTYMYYTCCEADLPICLEGLYARDTESFGPFTSLLTRFPDSQQRYYRRAHTLLHFGRHTIANCLTFRNLIKMI